jgi:uncharacterized RDD family membrane protein YckC
MAYEDPNTPSNLSGDDAQKIISTVDEGNSLLGGKYHPWRRFFSRIVEICTTGLVLFFLVLFVLGVVMPRQADEFMQAIDNPIIASIVLYLILLPAEAMMLSLFGTTPAKWLFGIRVTHSSGNLLYFSEALNREFRFFYQGVCFGIPFITLIPQLFAYRRLTKTGTTLWDKSTGAVVLHKKWGVIRTLFCTVTVLFVMILTSNFIAAGY